MTPKVPPGLKGMQGEFTCVGGAFMQRLTGSRREMWLCKPTHAPVCGNASTNIVASVGLIMREKESHSVSHFVGLSFTLLIHSTNAY